MLPKKIRIADEDKVSKENNEDVDTIFSDLEHKEDKNKISTEDKKQTIKEKRSGGHSAAKCD